MGKRSDGSPASSKDLFPSSRCANALVEIEPIQVGILKVARTLVRKSSLWWRCKLPPEPPDCTPLPHLPYNRHLGRSLRSLSLLESEFGELSLEPLLCLPLPVLFLYPTHLFPGQHTIFAHLFPTFGVHYESRYFPSSKIYFCTQSAPLSLPTWTGSLSISVLEKILKHNCDFSALKQKIQT